MDSTNRPTSIIQRFATLVAGISSVGVIRSAVNFLSIRTIDDFFSGLLFSLSFIVSIAFTYLAKQAETERKTVFVEMFVIAVVGLGSLAFLVPGPATPNTWDSSKGPMDLTHVKGVREVFFATDRNKTNWARFGEHRSANELLTLGKCMVSIPKTHERGNLERPWQVLTISIQEDPSKHIVIQNRAELSTDNFYAAFLQSLDNAPERSAFVFVHGFNVPFDDAVRSTAQLAWDMQFQGPALVYSWPSAGRGGAYVRDLDAVDWTIEHFEHFLRDLRSRTGVRVVHVIGHSMGAKVTTQTLRQLAHSGVKTAPFQELVLAAPDIDGDLLAQASMAIAQQSERATFYSSSRDRALRLASLLRMESPARAGHTLPADRMKCTRCDFIDATLAEASLLDHSYVAENSHLLNDLALLLRLRLGPDKRSITLESEPPLWVFRPPYR